MNGDYGDDGFTDSGPSSDFGSSDFDAYDSFDYQAETDFAVEPDFQADIFEMPESESFTTPDTVFEPETQPTDIAPFEPESFEPEPFTMPDAVFELETQPTDIAPFEPESFEPEPFNGPDTVFEPETQPANITPLEAEPFATPDAVLESETQSADIAPFEPEPFATPDVVLEPETQLTDREMPEPEPLEVVDTLEMPATTEPEPDLSPKNDLSPAEPSLSPDTEITLPGPLMDPLKIESEPTTKLESSELEPSVEPQTPLELIEPESEADLEQVPKEQPAPVEEEIESTIPTVPEPEGEPEQVPEEQLTPVEQEVEPGVEEKPEYSNPSHQKGADLENAYHEVLQEKDGNVIIPPHDSVTTPGFDLVYYDNEKDVLVISEEKNWGSLEHHRNVSDISAWNEDHFQTNLTNLGPQIDDMDIPQETKDEMKLAILEERLERELVVGPHTNVSDTQLEKYSVDRLIHLDPTDLSKMEIRPLK